MKMKDVAYLTADLIGLRRHAMKAAMEAAAKREAAAKLRIVAAETAQRSKTVVPEVVNKSGSTIKGELTGGYHGTSSSNGSIPRGYTANDIYLKGLPAKGNNYNIHQHVMGAENSGLRGTTQMWNGADDSVRSAAYFAGEKGILLF